MRMTLSTLLTLTVATCLPLGCEGQTEQDQMSLLQQENTDLRAQLEERDKALDAANDELRTANSELRDQRDQYEQDLAAASAVPSGFEGIEGVTANYGPNNTVTVSVEGDVLFDSGRTSLKSAAKQSLNLVASVLQSQYSGKTIYVAGHTDSDPIRKSGHKSNYHLGFERGWAVRNYLSEKGISSTNMAVMSYGPDRPMGSAKQSRRVEIVVAD